MALIFLWNKKKDTAIRVGAVDKVEIKLDAGDNLYHILLTLQSGEVVDFVSFEDEEKAYKQASKYFIQ